MAPNPAAMQGAIAQEAAICETLPFFQPQLTEISDAIPTPTRAPTIDCVVLTGKPRAVQIVSQVADPVQELHSPTIISLPEFYSPISATTMAKINVPGELLKGVIEKTPLRIVAVTSWPSEIAPMNSVIVASTPAWTKVKDLELTEVA